MNDDRQEELAALHALDLLEGAERTEFEAALAGDPRLRQRVQELREAASALAHAAPSVEPPPELKQRILASAGGSAGRKSAAGSGAAGADVGAPRGAAKTGAGKVISFPSLIPWAVAACFALAAAWAGQLYLSARSDAAAVRDQQKLADLELQSARTQIEEERLITQRQVVDSRQWLAARSKLEEEAGLGQKQLADSQRQIADLTDKLKAEGDLAQLKISTLASMLGNSPQALAVAVWNPVSQEGVLTVSKLPAAAGDKDYQLWVIDPQYKTPVSAGLVSVDPATPETRISFKPDKSVRSAAKFAISLERKGGSPTPSTVVLISQ